jgi:hypothetical protein
MNMKKLMIVALGCAIASGTLAQSQGFQASLTPDVAIQSQDTRINGVALSIWGENPQSAFALGFVNGSSGSSKGLSLGLANYADSYSGIALGAVNYATGDFIGAQLGFFNHAENMKGLQWGAVNCAGNLSGLQLGFINYANTAESGIQLGFVNIMDSTEKWFSGFPDELAPAMVFINWRM